MANLLDKIDWKALGDGLQKPVTDALKVIVEGEEEDIKEFGLRIATHMAGALQLESKAERDALMEELYDQLEGMAEIGRIRLVGTGWNTAKQILSVVFKSAVAVAGAIL